MANKGLDLTFVHYGIRKEDMNKIELLAKEQDIDIEWLKELIKSYHEKKIRNQEVEDKEIQKLIEEYLNKIEK